jgi:thymidylate synthase (FAD)
MKIDLLDHGYIKFIEASGTGKEGVRRFNVKPGDDYVDKNDYEVGIIEAARQSTQKGFQGWDSDAGLLAFLYNNQHMTPFEFADCVIEVQAPIVVLREWHRHRTQSYNEMSARYAPLPDLYYVPDYTDVASRMISAEFSKNKQAQAMAMSTDPVAIAEAFVGNLKGGYESCEEEYKQYLGWGIPKELARLIMPVGHYTRMRAKANLRNWLAFMTLRSAPNAMKEIRVYSDALGSILEAKFPRTFALFEGERKRREQEKRIVEMARKIANGYGKRSLIEDARLVTELVEVVNA